MIAVELITRSRSAEAIDPWGSNRPAGLQEVRRMAAPATDHEAGANDLPVSVKEIALPILQKHANDLTVDICFGSRPSQAAFTTI
jgi:hypothetical protein